MLRNILLNASLAQIVMCAEPFELLMLVRCFPVIQSFNAFIAEWLASHKLKLSKEECSDVIFQQLDFNSLQDGLLAHKLVLNKTYHISHIIYYDLWFLT